MLERIIASIALALFDWLAKRAERGSVALDADARPDELRRAGDALREWLHANRAGAGEQPDPRREKLPK